jgi:hypothetical protein
MTAIVFMTMFSDCTITVIQEMSNNNQYHRRHNQKKGRERKRNKLVQGKQQHAGTKQNQGGYAMVVFLKPMP